MNQALLVLGRGVLAVAPLAACLSGCQTTHRTSPAGAERAVLTPFASAAAWAVIESGAVKGTVVRFEAPSEDGRFIFVVRNLWDQDLGVVDALGRAWRHVPHEDAQWIGTGPVPDGVGQILGLGPDMTMRPESPGDLESITARARDPQDGG